MQEKITTEQMLDFLTDEQRIATKLLKNACVSAGAGSGKTRVLATRYVYLVAKYGFMPSEILTLTFTNKAAAEMYKRIFESLQMFESKMIDEQAKFNIQNAIKHFSEAKIQTLDSYCGSVIRSCVHHYGIPPTYSIDEGQLTQSIEEKSLEFLLSNRENKYLQTFLGTSKTVEFANSFFAKPILAHSTLANPIDFKTNFQNQIKENNQRFAESVTAVNDLQKSLQAYIDEGNKITENQLAFCEPFLDASFDLGVLVSPQIIDESFWVWLNSFYGFIEARKAREALGEMMEAGRKIYKDLASSLNFLLNQENLIGIMPLFEQFQDLVHNTKRSLGLLTFADTADLAIKTLLDYPEIRQIEKKAYKAIMIDEFQDDNILQKNLLYLISEKLELCGNTIPKAENLQSEKLFFVGDEKQSIYRFRGADVEVFRHLSKELPEKATLSTNFRSNPALIASFNAIFGGEDYPSVNEASVSENVQNVQNVKNIQNNQNEQSPKTHSSVFAPVNEELFEACYEKVQADPKKMPGAKYYPQNVHIALVPKIEEDPTAFNETEMQAIYVAQTIKQLIDEQNVNPSDIALLFRAKTNQSTYEHFLRQYSIPYTSDVPTSFFNDAPVNDILALLKLAIFPNDYLAFLTVLKSPFVRLSENSAIEILSLCRNLDESETEKLSSLVDFELCKSITPQEQERFLHFLKIFTELTTFIENHTIAECISKIWYNFGYVYETMWNPSVEAYSDFYDYLFALATKADSQNSTISDFLEDLANAKQDANKLKDLKVPLERKSSVQIMTIHASKGLEFKYVFVVELANSGHGETNSERTFFNEDLGVIINLPICKSIPNKDDKYVKNLFFDNAKDENAKRSKAEIKRLLYVAITRAEEKVFLVGKFPVKKDASDRLSFYSILEPHMIEFADETVKDAKQAELDNASSDTKKGKSTVGLQDYFVTTKDKSPFSEELIVPLAKDGFTPCLVGKPNTSEERVSVSNDLQNAYQEIAVIQVPEIKSNYKKPSKIHLKTDEAEHYTTNEPVFYAVDSLFKKKNKDENATIEEQDSDEEQEASNGQDFTEADFGIMAHACVEALFLKQDPAIPAKVLSKLTEKQIEIAMNDAQTVAKMFYESDLGILAQKADYLKTEYDFKMAVKTDDSVAIIDGQIDLMFYDKQTKSLYIVDFKTDKDEKPQRHYLQLVAYTRAASSFESSLQFENVKTFLYYLRSGNTVEITDKVANIDLGKNL